MRNKKIACLLIGGWLLGLTAGLARAPGAAATPSATAKPAPSPAVGGAKLPAPIHVEHLLKVTSPLYQPQPQYPSQAKAARIQGIVKLDAVITKDGTVQSLKLVSGHPLLVKAAMDAARKWRYRPPQIKGQPVEIEAVIAVKFSLPPCSPGDESCWASRMKPAKVYYHPSPRYTAAARRAGIQGTVTLRVFVGADGRVSDVHVTQPLDQELDEKAVETVKTWKYHPAMLDGKPVAVPVMVWINFRLR